MKRYCRETEMEWIEGGVEMASDGSECVCLAF